jgi:hypothetical protein
MDYMVWMPSPEALVPWLGASQGFRASRFVRRRLKLAVCDPVLEVRKRTNMREGLEKRRKKLGTFRGSGYFGSIERNSCLCDDTHLS